MPRGVLGAVLLFSLWVPGCIEGTPMPCGSPEGVRHGVVVQFVSDGTNVVLNRTDAYAYWGPPDSRSYQEFTVDNRGCGLVPLEGPTPGLSVRGRAPLEGDENCHARGGRDIDFGGGIEHVTVPLEHRCVYPTHT